MATNTPLPEVERAFYPLAEVAQILSLPLHTVREWGYANRIKTVKLGRRVMVPAVELDRIAVEGVK